MGIGLKMSTGSTPINSPKIVNPKNPDPYNFNIEKMMYTNGFTILIVNYPNCTNYEGQKILVYKGNVMNKLKDTNFLDPHFMENDISPIARFTPSDEGLQLVWDLIYRKKH